MVRIFPGASPLAAVYFLAAPARRLSLLGPLRWADATLKPHAWSSDGDAVIEVLREVVNRLMLAYPWRCSGMKAWVCDGLFFQAPTAVYAVLRVFAVRWGCSGGPPTRDWWFLASKAVEDTVQTSMACFGTCLCHV